MFFVEDMVNLDSCLLHFLVCKCAGKGGDGELIRLYEKAACVRVRMCTCGGCGGGYVRPVA